MRNFFALLFVASFFTSTAQDVVQGKIPLNQNGGSVNNNNQKVIDNENKTIFYPAITFQNPTSPGYFGVVVLGATFENKTRIANYPDANAAAYIGLGEPEKLIGGGITINIYGLTDKYGEQNNMGQGSFSFHLNKLLFNRKFLLDGGIDNLFFWGGEQSYISYQRSTYISGNYLFALRQGGLQTPFSYLSVTAGMGNGYYRTDKHYTLGKSGSFDPFFSLATPILKGTNIIGEWNGYDIGTGISSIPFQKVPFMVTFEATDFIFGHPRFITSLSFPFNFSKVKKSKEDFLQRPAFVKPIRSVRTM